MSKGESRKKRSQNRNLGESWQGTQRQMIRVVRREVAEKLKMEGKKVNCRWLKSEEVVAIFNGKERN